MASSLSRLIITQSYSNNFAHFKFKFLKIQSHTWPPNLTSYTISKILTTPLFINFSWLKPTSLREILTIFMIRLTCGHEFGLTILFKKITYTYQIYTNTNYNIALYAKNQVCRNKTQIMDINKTKDKIAQAYRHTQMHMNNVWSEMISCSPCFAFYCFSSIHWFIPTIWNISYPSMDYHCSLVLFLFFSHDFSIIFYWIQAI